MATQLTYRFFYGIKKNCIKIHNVKSHKLPPSPATAIQANQQLHWHHLRVARLVDKIMPLGPLSKATRLGPIEEWGVLCSIEKGPPPRSNWWCSQCPLTCAHILVHIVWQLWCLVGLLCCRLLKYLNGAVPLWGPFTTLIRIRVRVSLDWILLLIDGSSAWAAVSLLANRYGTCAGQALSNSSCSWSIVGCLQLCYFMSSLSPICFSSAVQFLLLVTAVTMLLHCSWTTP